MSNSTGKSRPALFILSLTFMTATVMATTRNSFAEGGTSVSLGFYSAPVNGMIRDGEFDQKGTRLDFKDDLGIKEASFKELRVDYSFSNERRLILIYRSISLEGRAVLAEDSVYNEETFLAGTEIKSDPFFSQVKAALGFNVLDESKTKLDLLLGVEYNWLNFKVSGTKINGERNKQGENFTAQELPLPFVGLDVSYEPADKWLIMISGTWYRFNNLNSFREDFGAVRLTQSSSEVNLLASYEISPNVLAGAGYRYFYYMQREESGKEHNLIRLETHGPMLYLAYKF